MDFGIWIALGGLLFTIGGIIWGFGWGSGAAKKQLEVISSSLLKTCTQLEEIKNSFQSFQLSSTKISTEAQTALAIVRQAVDTLQKNMQTNLAQLVNHSSDRSLHTDEEWRNGIVKQLDLIHEYISKRKGN